MARRASIIVRSMARPELADALDSLAQQTYPELEIVLVDATGGRHPAPAATCGPHRVLFVAGTSPRPRPVAANAGLDTATGEFIGFLDDDDRLEPGHVAGLVAALEAHPEVLVAYADTREVAADGTTMRVREEPYSRVLLFQDSYVALQASLFRASLTDSCRFDPTFDVFEDWDFWIQASAVTDFLRVPQASVIYRSSLGLSGLGQGANRDPSVIESYRRRIAVKWQAEGERVVAALEERYAAAESAFANGDRTRAEALVHDVLARYRYHVGALMLAGTIEALSGEFGAAAQHFSRAVTENPDDPQAHFNLAQARERQGSLADAAASYRRVLVLDPSHPHARARLARLEALMRP
jgi:glycosyltransferase involved in cell wall biosynthesis